LEVTFFWRRRYSTTSSPNISGMFTSMRMSANGPSASFWSRLARSCAPLAW
jgi:hypothetical protein